MVGTQAVEREVRGKFGEGDWARSFKTKVRNLDFILSVM